jgi:hypothetical protein
MIDSWANWSTLIWEAFAERHRATRETFEQLATRRFYRAFTPAADRVYDVVVLRPSGALAELMADPGAYSAGVEWLWGALNPAHEGVTYVYYPPAHSVEPEAASKRTLGPYTVIQAYVKRFAAASTFLHASFGKERTRDSYVIAMVSPIELVIVQCKLYDDTSRAAITEDLGAILRAPQD